jgi:hypothetical protein
MDSIKALAGWQAAAVSIALCLSEMTVTLNISDLSAVLILVTMFVIVAISALLAAITKSKFALYIMTAFLVAFAAVFFAFATPIAAFVVCLALGVCFAHAIDESRLMPACVIPLTFTEFLGILLPLSLSNHIWFLPVGFLFGTTCFIALLVSSFFFNDQKARKPKPASPA